MTRDYTRTPPLPKSAPVQSPLAASTKQLRIPQTRSPFKRFSHLPELHTRRRGSASPEEITTATPFHDKKRLVDQFYEPGTPGSAGASYYPSVTAGSTRMSTTTTTPSITRNNTQDDLMSENKFQFLKAFPQKKDPHKADEANSMMNEKVMSLEIEVEKRLKQHIGQSDLDMAETKTQFYGMQLEIRQLKQKLQVYIGLLKDKAKTVEMDHEKFQEEVRKLYKSLSALDQYEKAVEESRDKLLAHKKKLQDLTALIETTEKNAKRREARQARKKILVTIFSLVLLLYCIWNMV